MPDQLFIYLLILWAVLMSILGYGYYKNGRISLKLLWLVLSLPFRVILGFFFDLKKIRNEYKAGYSSFDKAIDKDVESEETSFERGEKFENYLEENIFPDNRFDLVEKTHSYQTNSGRYVESSMNPDFKFRDKKSGKTFWVEAKYRKHFFRGKVEWCSSRAQLSRYRKASEPMPLFLALGMGGRPDAPQYISLIRLDGKYLKYRHMFKNEVEQYTIDPNSPVKNLYP